MLLFLFELFPSDGWPHWSNMGSNRTHPSFPTDYKQYLQCLGRLQLVQHIFMLWKTSKCQRQDLGQLPGPVQLVLLDPVWLTNGSRHQFWGAEIINLRSCSWWSRWQAQSSRFNSFHYCKRTVEYCRTYVYEEKKSAYKSEPFPMKQLPQSALLQSWESPTFTSTLPQNGLVQPPCRLSFTLKQVFHSGKHFESPSWKWGSKTFSLLNLIKIPKIAKDPCRCSSRLHGGHDSFGLFATNP